MALSPYARRVLAGALAIAAIFPVAWFLIPSSPPNTLSEKGYLKIVPPSTLHRPGTINTIEIIGDGRIKLHPTCELDADALKIHTRISRTVDEEIVQALHREFDISGKIGDLLLADVRVKNKYTTHILFKDAYLITMSSESLLELQEKYVLGSCEEAIVWNLEHRGIVCQAKEVLMADVVVEINYSKDLSASEKVQTTHKIAGELNMMVQPETASRVVGEGLFYGVRLAPLGIVLDKPGAIKVNCRPLR